MNAEEKIQPSGATAKQIKRHLPFAMTTLVLFAVFAPLIVTASEDPVYDEIIIYVNVHQVGTLEVPAVIKDEELFLPVTEIFNFLKIRNELSRGMDSVTGYFIHPESTYVIDQINHRITYKGQIFELKPDDLIRTETNLYLRSRFFGEVFALHCTFNFRSLSADIETKLDIPVIREMRREMIRRNMHRLKREIKPDTTIKRTTPLFHWGMADWFAVVTQRPDQKTDTRLNLKLGALLAGGDATISLSYQNNVPFGLKRQNFLWRFVNNDHSLVRQIKVGKIATQATATLLSPVAGVQVTNTPTTYRRSFGTYTISDFTEPNWIVELYVNEVLVNYTRANDAGFFSFDVPLVYGNSVVKHKYYGPWGEERFSERQISIPFSLLPAKEMEYTISAGMVEDTLYSRFGRAAFNYGLNRRMTVGWGMEYLSSVATGKFMPYVNTTVRVGSNLLLAGEYTHKVRSKGTASYRLPSGLQLELNYIKYAKGQTAINNRYLEERKVALSKPWRTRHFTLFSRLTLNQIVAPRTIYSRNTKYRDIPKTKLTTADLLLSGTWRRLSANLSTSGLFAHRSPAVVYGNLSLAYRLPANFVLRPQGQFQYNDARLMFAKLELEKQLPGKGFINIAYERNVQAQVNSFTVGFRFDLSFVRAAVSVRQSNKKTATVFSASGSLSYEPQTHYIGFNNRSSVGRGGIVVLTFLDFNGNGRREDYEPKIEGLKLKINGGRIVRDVRNTVIRILDLAPYTDYYIELDGNDFDNIAWRIKKKTIRITINPNQMKWLEVPVTVVAEATGTVYLNNGNDKKGLAGIIVSFYNSDSVLIGKTLTEYDGYFSFLGLSPGKYTLKIDSGQLHRLQLEAAPRSIPLTISAARSEEGLFIEGLDFMLRSVSGNAGENK